MQNEGQTEKNGENLISRHVNLIISFGCCIFEEDGLTMAKVNELKKRKISFVALKACLFFWKTSFIYCKS